MNQDVCYTREECEILYAALPEEKRKPAATKLLELLSKEPGAVDKIRGLISQYGRHEWLWHLHDDEIAKISEEDKQRGYYAGFYNPHFSFGMAVRNALRSAGFGEDYFGIHNLDDIYVDVIEEAVA